jgi:signal transduction histidine kinase
VEWAPVPAGCPIVLVEAGACGGTPMTGQFPALGHRSGWRRFGEVLIVAAAVVVDLAAWAGDRAVRGGPMPPLVIVPIVTIVVYSTLFLRWRYPVGVFVVQWLFTLSSLVIPAFQPFAGLLVALYAVAGCRRGSWSGPALASTALPFSIYSAYAAGMGPGGSTTGFIRMLLLWLLVAGATWGVGRLSYLARQRARRHDELVAAETAEAVRTERMNLARELHDIVAHTVTIMVVQASGAKAVLSPDQTRVRNALEVIENSGTQAMMELHRLLHLLRSVDTESNSASASALPGLDGLSHLLATVEQAGTPVTVTEQGEAGPLDPSVGTAAYRVIQEAITNAVKHGGTAAAINIQLCWSSVDLEVAVTSREHGVALPPDQVAALSSGQGLAGLQDRVTMVGGTLTFGPAGDAFTVTARLPRPGRSAAAVTPVDGRP